MVEASPAPTWDALLDAMDASGSSTATRRLVRLLGCADAEPSGPRPLASGSAIPGFHVERAVPGRELALRGAHRFSDYALTFRLDGVEEGTRLRAETRATFPGARGCAYRAMVIGTRGHVLATRRLLHAIKRRAERPSVPSQPSPAR